MRLANVALAATLTLLPALGQAQNTNCAPREAVVGKLQQKYGESPQSMGINNKGVIVEIWANLETGSWTALLSRPDGLSCMVSAGRSFEIISPAPEGEAL